MRSNMMELVRRKQRIKFDMKIWGLVLLCQCFATVCIESLGAAILSPAPCSVKGQTRTSVTLSWDDFRADCERRFVQEYKEGEGIRKQFTCVSNYCHLQGCAIQLTKKVIFLSCIYTDVSSLNEMVICWKLILINWV